MDVSSTGKLDFHDFVVGLWNYCKLNVCVERERGRVASLPARLPALYLIPPTSTKHTTSHVPTHSSPLSYFTSHPPSLPGTVTDASLAMMSFDIYDRDSKGRIEYEHMEEMVKVSERLQRVG